MKVRERMRAVKNAVYVGGAFVFIDVIYFIFYSLSTSGYVELDLESRLLLAKAWNIVHAPTNDVFGPYVFPYFKDHADAWTTLVSMMPYLMLCFFQVFAGGFLLGYIVSRAMRLLITSGSIKI